MCKDPEDIGGVSERQCSGSREREWEREGREVRGPCGYWA